MQARVKVERDGTAVVGGVQMVIWILATVVAIITHAALGVVIPTRWPSDANQWTGESALLSGIGTIALIGIIALTVLMVRRRRMQSSFDVVSWFLTVFSVSGLVLLLLAGALTIADLIGSKGFVSALVTRLLGVVASLTIAGVFGFVTALLIARPTRRIRAYLIAQAVCFALLVLGGALSVTTSAGVVNVITLTAISSVLILINPPRLPWLPTLRLEQKLRLLWLTCCAALASILMTVVLLQDNILSVSVSTLIAGLHVTYSALSVIALTVFLRLAVMVLYALPNSTVVDRRSLEISSLSALARLMAESASTEDVLARTTELAVRVTQAHGAWAEMGTGITATIVATQHVHPDYVQALHRNPLIRDLIVNANQAVVIDSLADYGVDVRSLAVRSLVIVPIAIDGERCATLVAFMTAEYGFHPDDHRLLAAFGDIISIAIEQSRLHASVLERERLQNEADVAREIQTSLLPRQHPLIDRFDLFGIMVPASEVGGDYFDYVRFADGSLGVVIADVAGKGIPAALYMATLKGAVLAEAREATSPADLLYRLSLTLSGQMERRTYITMSCVQIRSDRPMISYARAGHSPLILRTRTGVSVLRPKGVAIGLLPPEEFRSHLEELCVELTPNDVCLLTTDGVTERRNAALQEVGTEAIMEVLTDEESLSSKEIVTRVQDRLLEHAQGAEAHDDVTIVALRYSNESPLQPESHQ